MFSHCAAPVELSTLRHQQEHAIFRLLDVAVPVLMRYDPATINWESLRRPIFQRRIRVPLPLTPRRSAISARDWRIRQQVERRRFVATLPTYPASLLPVVLSGRVVQPWMPTNDHRQFAFTPETLQRAAERIASGRQPCELLWEHDPSIRLASVASGTLSVFFQECPACPTFSGLAFSARLLDTREGRAALRHVATGRFAASLGFTSHDVPNWRGGSNLQTDATVDEISIVANPASSQSWIKLGWFVPEEKQWAILYGTT